MTTRLTTVLAVLWLAVLPLGAEEPVPLSPPFSEVISLDLKEAKTSEVFALFAEITGARFVVVPPIEKPLSVRLDGVRVKLALDVICESLGCRWAYYGPPTDDRVEVTKRLDLGAPGVSGGPKLLDEPLELNLREADPKAVLASFAQILGAEVAFEGLLDGKLTVELKALPARKALDEICARLGCRWELLDGPVVTLRVVKQ